MKIIKEIKVINNWQRNNFEQKQILREAGRKLTE